MCNQQGFWVQIPLLPPTPIYPLLVIYIQHEYNYTFFLNSLIFIHPHPLAGLTSANSHTLIKNCRDTGRYVKPYCSNLPYYSII